MLLRVICVSDGLEEGVGSPQSSKHCFESHPSRTREGERGFVKCSVETLFIQMTGRKQWWQQVGEGGQEGAGQVSTATL